MITTSFRLPSRLKARLYARAAEDRRSANSLLVILLDDALTAAGHPKEVHEKDH